MEFYGYSYAYKPETEPRAVLSSLVDRTLGCLSGLRPYARRAQQAANDILYREGVALIHDLDHDPSLDLATLCTQTDTWTDKVMNWIAVVSDMVRGLWGQARTRFTPRRTATPPSQPSPDQQPTFEQLVTDVQELKVEVATIKTQVADLKVEMGTGFATAKQEREAGFAAAKQEREAGFAAAKQEREAGFAAAKQEREAGFAAAKQEREAGFTAAKQEREAGFTAAKQERKAGFATAKQEREAGFTALHAKLDKELHIERVARANIMSDRRLGEYLEGRLNGYVTHTVNQTLRPQFKADLDVKTWWSDAMLPYRWNRIAKSLNMDQILCLETPRLDLLLEITWGARHTPRTFLACEATVTLDQEHIAKLTDACQEIVAADHQVIGILGYSKAQDSDLVAARETDLVLWRFPADKESFIEETAGLPLAYRLQALAAEVTTPEPGTDG